MERQHDDNVDEAHSVKSEPKRDLRSDMMNRERREHALAWVQAQRLIRGGLDEVAEIVEESQHTIELLLGMLNEAACPSCNGADTEAHAHCEFCRRREAMLALLI